MKVCILSEYFYPDNTGGTGTVLSKLVRHLQDTYDDLEFDVITSKNLFRGHSDGLPPREDWDGIAITRLNTPQPRKRSVRRRLAANLVFTYAAFRKLLAMRRKYDLILVVTAPPTLPLAASLFSRLTGTPYVYLVYDLYLDLAVAMNMVSPQSRIIKSLKSIQQHWLHRAARVIVLGRCMKEHVATCYQVPPERIEVVPIAGSVEQIVPTGKDTQFRQRNGLEGFIALYAGNFAQYQDFDTLLDAAKLVQQQQEMTFVFVGDGAKRSYIEGRVKDEKLSNVRVLPFVPEEELCDLLASADVSLVTLERGVEGLAVPSKFYNILASGRPTVAVVSPTSEVGRVVQEGHCGVQVEPENPAQLAQVLAKLAVSPADVEWMGHNARRLCEEKYALEHVGQQFFEIFADVVSQHGRRHCAVKAVAAQHAVPHAVAQHAVAQHADALCATKSAQELVLDHHG